MKKEKKYIDSISCKFAYLLICTVFISCNTYNRIPGIYVYNFSYTYDKLILYPDSTYKAYYRYEFWEAKCDSGKWIAKNNKDSIELRSTLPNPMNIPIDVTEEETDKEGITIIFNRPYKKWITRYEKEGIENDILEWEVIINGEKLRLGHDTLLIDKESVENIAIEATRPEVIHDCLSPSYTFINTKIKTETYTVKDKGCNKFTIILPPYVREWNHYDAVNIFHAKPINRTVSFKKIKNNYKKYRIPPK